MINHQIVEVNGQNVVGLSDPEIQQLIRESPRSVTLSIMPSFVFNYLIDKYVHRVSWSYLGKTIPFSPSHFLEVQTDLRPLLTLCSITTKRLKKMMDRGIPDW